MTTNAAQSYYFKHLKTFLITFLIMYHEQPFSYHQVHNRTAKYDFVKWKR